MPHLPSLSAGIYPDDDLHVLIPTLYHFTSAVGASRSLTGDVTTVIHNCFEMICRLPDLHWSELSHKQLPLGAHLLPPPDNATPEVLG